MDAINVTFQIESNMPRMDIKVRNPMSMKKAEATNNTA